MGRHGGQAARARWSAGEDFVISGDLSAPERVVAQPDCLQARLFIFINGIMAGGNAGLAMSKGLPV